MKKLVEGGGTTIDLSVWFFGIQPCSGEVSQDDVVAVGRI
jgi:hypothetical protein